MTNKELIIGFFMEGYIHHNYDFLMEHMAANYFDNSPCAARTNLECVNVLKSTEQIFPNMQVDIHKEQVLINQCVEKITKLLFLFQGVFSEQKISYLKRIYREEIAQTLSGSIIQYIEPRLSFENEHCKEILRKPDGVRQRSANEYQDQLLKEAELFFLEECRKVSIKHIRRVQDDVRAELNVLEKDYNDKMAMLTKRQEEAQDENQIDLERASLAILQMELTMLADFTSQS